MLRKSAHITDGSQRRGTRFVLALVLVAVIAALAIFYSVSTVISKKHAAHDVIPTSTIPRMATPTPTGNGSICGLKEVQKSGSLGAAPKNVQWTYVGQIAVPSLDGQGPGKIDAKDQFRSCYAQTPSGALLAATNLVALGSTPTTQMRMVHELFVPGVGRSAALARFGNGPTGDYSRMRLQVMGFRLLRYTGTTADVDIAIQTSQGTYLSQVYNLEWNEGDWKVVTTETGELPLQAAPIPSLYGYITWGAS